MRAAKLGALVREHWKKEGARRYEPSAFPGGAALFDRDRSRAWVLIDDASIARFGPALAWAWRQEAGEVHVLVEVAAPGAPAASGVMARRASAWADPPRVWDVQGRDISVAAPADAVAPDSQSAWAEMQDSIRAYGELMRAHGAEPILEHGVLRGEVLGLEVARLVGAELQVGVGRHDRMARAEMYPDQDPGRALDEAVGVVRARRRRGEPRHPANTLARGRWLRSVVCARPELAGARELVPVSPPLPWFDLPEAGAAPASGTSLPPERPLIAVCSVGVDLNLVPTAADSRLIHGPGAELVVVVPEGDDVPITRALAGSLAEPAEVRVVPRGWEDLI